MLLGLVGLLPAKADTSAARILRRTDDEDDCNDDDDDDDEDNDDNDDDEATAPDATNRFMILGRLLLSLSQEVILIFD